MIKKIPCLGDPSGKKKNLIHQELYKDKIYLIFKHKSIYTKEDDNFCYPLMMLDIKYLVLQEQYISQIKQ